MDDVKKLMQNPFARGNINVYDYWEKNKRVGIYGVPYLDKELLGISKSDLVVIGARSGAGKSSLAKIIYQANDINKTALFSLENYAGDLEMSMLRKEYNKRTNSNYTAREWQLGPSGLNENELGAALGTIQKGLNGAFIFGRVPPQEYGPAWNIESLQKMIVWCAQHGIELIIIDHLDYLDRDNPNESDNSHITELMKSIRSAQELGSAVVAFSHLRKPQGKVDDLIVPNENEFIGSSNKVKQATQVVMFAPANDGDAIQGYGTWCCIRKNRNGGVKNQAAKMFYLPDTETYEDSYDLYTINYSGTKVEQITMDGIEISQKPKKFG